MQSRAATTVCHAPAHGAVACARGQPETTRLYKTLQAHWLGFRAAIETEHRWPSLGTRGHSQTASTRTHPACTSSSDGRVKPLRMALAVPTAETVLDGERRCGVLTAGS